MYRLLKIIIIIVFAILVNSISFSQSVKIMAWNIFMVPPVIFKSCQTERAYLISDYILKIDPDIVSLEETFMKSTRAIIHEQLKEKYPYQSNITKSGLLKSNSGVWILSKYPIEQQAFITYKNKKGSDIFAKKGATFVEINIQNKRIQIVGTHTQSLPKYRSTRELQFKQIKKEIADKYFTDSIPQFIVGDLNCNFLDTEACTNMLRLLNVSNVSFTGEKYSWNGIDNDLAHKFSEHTLEILDYILLRNQHKNIAEMQSIEILKPYNDACFCKWKFHNLSDHHPIMSTIDLK